MVTKLKDLAKYTDYYLNIHDFAAVGSDMQKYPKYTYILAL